MIIYTSGTTGRPKGAVHVHGGFPIKGAQDLAHCFDLGPGDRLFWFTDLGWMMGPWAIYGALLLGAELVLYEGAPDYPGPDRLWALVARHRVTHLGLSPTVIRALMAHGTEPRARTTTCVACACSARPASRGIPSRGGGSSATSAAAGCRSSTTAAAPRSVAASSRCNLLTPIKPTSFGGPSVGAAADVIDAAGDSVRGDGRRAGAAAAVAGHDPRVLERSRALPRDVLVARSRVPGCTATGRSSMRTATGSSRAARTTRSRWPASASGRPRWRARRLPTRRSLEAAAVGVPHEVKGEAIVVFCVLRPGEADDPDLRRSISPGSRPAWARRSARERSTSSPTCRAPGRARSCVASPARPTWAPTRATSRRSRIRWRSRRSGPFDRPADHHGIRGSSVAEHRLESRRQARRSPRPSRGRIHRAVPCGIGATGHPGCQGLVRHHR